MTIHHFCTENAALYGLEESIVLQNIGFWCATNLSNRKHIHDGNVWTYNTREAFLEQFPYIAHGKTEKARLTKIGRILQSLEKQGAIVSTDKLNKHSHDRTKWYAISDPENLTKYAEIGLEALKTLRDHICSLDRSYLFPREIISVPSLTDNKQQIINSKSVNNARVISNFVDQPENPTTAHSTKSYYRENAAEKLLFVDQVMTELLADNMPENKKRYAKMKITEYLERFPGSQSVADCWSYVVTAVNHQISLTGS